MTLRRNKRSFSGCLLTWRHRHNNSLPDAQNWKSSIERPSKNRGYLPVAPLECPNQPGNRCCYNIEPSQKCWVFFISRTVCAWSIICRVDLLTADDIACLQPIATWSGTCWPISGVPSESKNSRVTYIFNKNTRPRRSDFSFYVKSRTTAG